MTKRNCAPSPDRFLFFKSESLNGERMGPRRKILLGGPEQKTILGRIKIKRKLGKNLRKNIRNSQASDGLW
jgi:hypothetical protein